MKVATPAGDDSYAKRYTRRPDAASATRGTHDKLTSKDPFSNGLRAFATRFSFVCHRQATVEMFRSR
jgi:hypothetical protein